MIVHAWGSCWTWCFTNPRASENVTHWVVLRSQQHTYFHKCGGRNVLSSLQNSPQRREYACTQWGCVVGGELKVPQVCVCVPCPVKMYPCENVPLSVRILVSVRG